MGGVSPPVFCANLREAKRLLYTMGVYRDMNDVGAIHELPIPKYGIFTAFRMTSQDGGLLTPFL